MINPEELYRVQLGAFENYSNAQKMRDELRAAGYEDAFIVLPKEPKPVGDEAGLSISNSPADNKAALEALSGTSKDVLLPNGDYPVAEWPKIDNYSGTITMAGSRLVFSNPSGRGLHFRGGSPKLVDYSHTYASPPPAGNPVGPNALTFLNTTDALVDGAHIAASPSAGMVFYDSIRPTVRDTLIENTGRDGLHFDKNVDPTVDGYHSKNTGDDGLAFVNHGGTKESATGGAARNVLVEDARSTRGIVFVGHSNILMEEFEIRRTHASGVYIAFETYYDTAVPTGVILRNGRIEDAGRLKKNGGDASHRHGVYYWQSGEGMEAHNIAVVNPGGEVVKVSSSAVAPDPSDIKAG